MSERCRSSAGSQTAPVSTSAIAEVTGIAERLASEHPDTNRNTRARVVPINDRFLGSADRCRLARLHDGRLHRGADLVRQRRQPDARSIAAAGARAGDSRLGGRQPYPARSSAAGRGRWSSPRPAPAIGLLVAIGGMRVFRRAIPGDALPYWFDYSIDWRVLAALIGVSAAHGPGLRARAGHSGLEDRRRRRPQGRRTLERRRPPSRPGVHVPGGAGRAGRRAARALRGQPSHRPARACSSDRIFDRTDIVTAALTLPAAKYPSAAARSAFYDALLDRACAGRGTIAAAAIASALPASGGESKES